MLGILSAVQHAPRTYLAPWAARALQPMSVRAALSAWLWWQLWHSADMQRRIAAAHSLARVRGWSSELEHAHVRCAIYAMPGRFEGSEPTW